MKKLIALLLALVMVIGLVACGETTPETPDVPETTEGNTPETTEGTEAPEETTAAQVEAPEVIGYAEFDSAPLDTQVCVETYIQAVESWWDGYVQLYTQNEEGAYYIYNLACSEEEAAQLVPGTKIRVTGFKAEWAGEIEIMDGTVEVLDAEPVVYDATDVTELLGTEELIAHQNEKVSFTGLTVDGIEFKNGEPGDDIYVTVVYGDATYSFCVEMYLTGPDTEVYQTVSALEAGDVINVEGFLYWYEGVNTHITGVTVAE